MLYSYRQMRRDYKIMFTDKSKANLWIHLDLAKVHRLKGLTSPYIISYLHFLNLNNILTLPHTFVVTEAGFGLTLLMFAFSSARFTRIRASLGNQNKYKLSITAVIPGMYNIPMISHVSVMTLCCHCSLYAVFNVFSLLEKLCIYQFNLFFHLIKNYLIQTNKQCS